MGWTGFVITVTVLLIGYFTGTLRPTGLLSRQPNLTGVSLFARILPLFLLLAGLGLFWTFGYNGIWHRLQIDLDGTIVSRQDLPQTPSTHGPTTVYKLKQSDGSLVEYTASRNDASLPRTPPIGGRLIKRRGEFSYLLSGERVDDFPLPAYVGFLAVALVCWVGAGLMLRRDRSASKSS
jgi:hypothetical protein